MNNLLLEIYGEEIPSSSQILIEKQFSTFTPEMNPITFSLSELF